MEIFLFLYIKGVGVGGVLCTNFDSDMMQFCLYATPVIRCKLSVKKSS